MNFFFHNWKSWKHCERPLLEWCNAFTPFLLPISQKNGSTLFFRLYHTHAPYFFEILVYCYSWPVCSDTVWINLWRRGGLPASGSFFCARLSQDLPRDFYFANKMWLHEQKGSVEYSYQCSQLWMEFENTAVLQI